MKRIHLFPWKGKITGLWKPGRRQGDRQRFCCHFRRTKLGKSKLCQGFCLVRLNRFQQKGHFVFLELYPGFSRVWATPERLSSLPECLKPCLAHIHAGFPHYTGFYSELNSFFSYIKGNFQVEIFSHSSGTGSAFFTFIVTKFFTSETWQLQLLWGTDFSDWSSL